MLSHSWWGILGHSSLWKIHHISQFTPVIQWYFFSNSKHLQLCLLILVFSNSLICLTFSGDDPAPQQKQVHLPLHLSPGCFWHLDVVPWWVHLAVINIIIVLMGVSRINYVSARFASSASDIKKFSLVVTFISLCLTDLVINFLLSSDIFAFCLFFSLE